MKLLESNATLLNQASGLEGVFKHIELCGRTAYKSEDKITENSSESFIKMLKLSQHLSVLEHGTIYLYLEVNPDNVFKSFDYPLTGYTTSYNFSDVVGNIAARYRGNQYSRVFSSVTTVLDGHAYIRKVYITTNYRVIVENEWYDDLQFICTPTKFHVPRYTIKCICDRGVSHELVRHRNMSFTQESQRFCNYSNEDKFGNEISFILPYWLVLNTGQYRIIKDNENEEIVGDGYIKDITKDKSKDTVFLKSCLDAEANYLSLINDYDCKPQEAREVLPNATKTTICITGFIDEWKHFFDLRYYGITGAPHPDMEVLTGKIVKEFQKANLWEQFSKK